MKYQEFIQNIKQHVLSQVDSSHKVIIQSVVKNNGTIYDGLIIIDPILNISPTIYLNPYYHRYLNGVSIEDICDDILTTYHENLPDKDFDISLFKNFSKAKKNIIIKLVSYSRNEELLQDIPHIRFYDLAIIFVVAVCDFMNEFATILIHNQHLDLWKVTSEELYSIAIKNTPKLLPYRFDPMEKILAHLEDSSPKFSTEFQMNVLTNHIKVHGATCITYPGLLKHLADTFEDNLIIIPSSIHEVLIIPESTTPKEYTIQDYNEMIVEINETQLMDDEILSDHTYIYLRADEKIIY